MSLLKPDYLISKNSQPLSSNTPRQKFLLKPDYIFTKEQSSEVKIKAHCTHKNSINLGQTHTESKPKITKKSGSLLHPDYIFSNGGKKDDPTKSLAIKERFCDEQNGVVDKIESPEYTKQQGSLLKPSYINKETNKESSISDLQAKDKSSFQFKKRKLPSVNDFSNQVNKRKHECLIDKDNLEKTKDYDDIKNKKKEMKKITKTTQIKKSIKEKYTNYELPEVKGIFSGNETKQTNSHNISHNDNLSESYNDDVDVEKFTLIKEVKHSEKPFVEATLPHWISIATTFASTLDVREPLKDVCPNLNENLLKRLKQKQIKTFFPVQKAVIPDVINSFDKRMRFRPQDLCVAAPTGSGKTLAYVIPILHNLATQHYMGTCLKALVILPTITLAKQVFEVFELYTGSVGLTVGSAFKSATRALHQTLFEVNHNRSRSKYDILITIPGTLNELLVVNGNTIDFTSLRYLVLDEADRLVCDDMWESVDRIQRLILESQKSVVSPLLHPVLNFCPYDMQQQQQQQQLQQNNKRPHKHKSSTSTTAFPNPPSLPPFPLTLPSNIMQRLLFSATLLHDPHQLQSIALHRPKLYAPQVKSRKKETSVKIMHEKPSTLIEEFVIVQDEVKPLALHLILLQQLETAETLTDLSSCILVFTNSADSAHKLFLLLKALSNSRYIVLQFAGQQKHISTVERLRHSKKSYVVVANDGLARGMDFHNVSCVVSYNVTSLTNYIHRVGRTARAGKEGIVVSLLTKYEESVFRGRCLQGTRSAQLRHLCEENLQNLQNEYESALKQVDEELRQEQSESRVTKSRNTNKKQRGNRLHRNFTSKKSRRGYK